MGIVVIWYTPKSSLRRLRRRDAEIIAEAAAAFKLQRLERRSRLSDDFGVLNAAGASATISASQSRSRLSNDFGITTLQLL